LSNKEGFKEFLKKKIEKSGLNINQVSKKTGISNATLSLFFKGERNLSAGMLVKLAPLLFMTESEILEAAGLLSQSEEILKKKVFDPDYEPNDIDLEDLLRVGNVTLFGEKLEPGDKEALLEMAKLVWKERRRVRKEHGI
jgi:transcriptional regulator with XRE-family HTH domain